MSGMSAQRLDSLGERAARAPSWQAVTQIPVGTDWFSYPYVGAPWDHRCEGLRSRYLSVSVIVPVWNSATSIGHCLRAIGRSSLNRLAPTRLEVIVCDDGSTDDSWSQILTSGEAIDLTALRLPHRNQSAALNAGLDRARGDIVAFCDSDIVMGCGALDELAARHEHWTDAACFGFRSNLPAGRLDDTPHWPLMHTEAFSRDNRVSFDLPTLVPNMLDACGWLSHLSDGRYLLDSQGSEWRRHRLVYGCLFSVRRDQLAQCGGFPDALHGWGYGDTLVAARFEADGGFLLPVASAWGHHVEHDIRHPDQWFQMRRNDLAYRYLLHQPPKAAPWRTANHDPSLDIATSPHSTRPELLHPADIQADAAALGALGRWPECLAIAEPTGEHELVAQCLYRMARYDEAVETEAGDRCLWGALSHHRLGRTDRAAHALESAAVGDQHSAYALSSSVPELLFLADHYESLGMTEVARVHRAVADIQATRDGEGSARPRGGCG